MSRHIELSRQATWWWSLRPPPTEARPRKAWHDLASTVLMATDKPVLMAPAMNVRMWLHAATVRNLQTLTADGVQFVGPDEGEMACGEFGYGRMAEPEAIFAATLELLDGPAARPLKGRRVLVTAGPTLEPIDRCAPTTARAQAGLRGGRSAGRLGDDCAGVGPRRASPIAGAGPVITAGDARPARPRCRGTWRLVAAVADWRPRRVRAKMKKGAGPPVGSAVENPDILARCRDGIGAAHAGGRLSRRSGRRQRQRQGELESKG